MSERGLSQDDIVPTVPSKLLGYEDSPIEYCLTPDGNIDNTSIKASSFSRFIYRLATLKAIREHYMELYIMRTRDVRNVYKDIAQPDAQYDQPRLSN
jgi:hypothetical protein